MLNSGERRSEVFVLRPAPGTLAFLAILVGWAPVLGVVTFLFGQGQVYGAALSLGAILIWGSVATLRIMVDSGHLQKKVFWRSRWSVNLADVSFTEGRGGDIPFIPAIIISDKSTGRKMGEILKPQFRAKDLAALQTFITSEGVELAATERVGEVKR